ncbi:MAG TPA: aminotransferase class V-fold PLP-dependent enzyme [Chitinophagaceae bacterium]|nr:aminotransferase class V-fold PLP-dependent enzyme [Chitinophagaceae bacterium]
MPHNRKKFIQQVGAGLFASSIAGWASAENITTTIMDTKDLEQEGAADDERFWKQFARKYYDVTGDYINLENGYYGLQSKPVLEAYLKNISYINREAIRFARKVYPDTFIAIKKELATFLGVSDEEIIITRNATEAMNIAIQGYPFKKGDEVLLNQLDYYSMIETFRMLEKRGEIKVKPFDMPLLPANEEEIVEVYRAAITPQTKVILLTHVSNVNGLVIPVAKIAAIAREKGIDTMTDSAHALGQIPFSLPALGSDFVGMNLHKWIGNPIGAGVLYVKKERIQEMGAFFGDIASPGNSINKLAHFGTTPFAVIMTIPDSLRFHQQVGVERISARLHYLKSLWVNELQEDAGIEVVTPVDLSRAIASFRIKDKRAGEVADHLLKQHGILTIARSLGNDGCIRVTPSVYTSADDMKKLVAGIRSINK